jgi:hypothetical protein
MLSWSSPPWAYELEREILFPARERLDRAKAELLSAQAAESEAFWRFKEEFDARLAQEQEQEGESEE